MFESNLDSQASRFASTACGGCELGSVCLCSSLPVDERLRLIDQVSRPLTIAAGEHLYRSGDPFRYFYAIKSGHTKTYAQNSNGDERVVGFQMAGDALGLEALHTQRHGVNAVALTDATFCRISIQSFSRVAAEVPEMLRQLLTLLSRDLAGHHAWLITENLRATRRVATFLVEIAEKLATRGNTATELTLAMSRADIGSYLNLAHETVTRCLSELRREGIVEARKRKLTILDFERLLELAAQ